MASLIGCGFPWHNFWMFFLFGMEVFCSTRTITGVQNFNKVDFCPQNKTEWQKASTRLNCTNIANKPKNRYHCLPIYDLSTLMEFCYNETRPRVVKGLCMAYVQRSNALNSYNCSTFNEGCPERNYFSDEVYEFPECTNINPISRCYAAESSCRPTPAKERKTKDHAFLVTVIVLVVLALSGIIVAVILRLILYKKRKKKKENEQTKVDENKLRGFLRKKEIKISHLRCIIVGCAQAGKTTFLKRLETTKFEKLKNIKTTEMADVHVNIFEVSEDGKTIERVKEKLPTIIFSPNLVKFKHNETPEEQISTNADDETETIAESVELLYLNRTYDENTTPKVQITANAEILQSLEVGDTDKVESSSSLPQSTDNILPISNEIHQNVETNQDHTSNEKYAMAKIMDSLEQIDKNPGPRITFIDFAGQSQYYAFHQIYLSPKTCYILVVDMTKRPDEKVPDPHGEAGSRFVSWTYRDYYRFWLNSIDSFSDPEAQVIVVGTHADQISTEKRQTFFDEFFKTLCSTHHQRHLNEQRKFTIGFPKSGQKLQDLGDIKNYIASLVQDQVSIKPLWAIFEKIFEKEKKQKIISREMVSMWNNAISKDLQMTYTEISHMLLFFHTVGMLLYFDEDNLKETIILDIQWFSDAFKSIIAYDVDMKDTDKDRKLFLNTGELSDRELDELWERERKNEYNKHKKKILPYMEQLGLLAICNTENPETKEMRTWYYIPSMNKRPYEIDDQECSKSSILCFKFDDKGQLPMFVFYKAIVKCMKIPGWSIFKNCIYENMAIFSYRGLLVKICLCAYQIQVQVCVQKREFIDRELENIQTSIEKKIIELNYPFEIGYKCKGTFNADEKNFISLKRFPVTQMICETCNKVHNVEDKICWVTTGKSENQDPIENIPQNQPKDKAFDGSEAKKPRCSTNKQLVAAIDIGTSYSGHAFSSRGDFENDPLRITAHKWSQNQFAHKTPTSALFDKNQTLTAFGYEAEKIFRELSEDGKHEEHYFFERFKMQLYNKSGDKEKKRLTNKSMICDISGKELPAMYVFSKAIKYMHDHLLKRLKEQDDNEIAEEEIKWVLTVPGIWDNSAKQFMRDAAEQAGIRSEYLIIALEPEAASLYCKEIPLLKEFQTFSPGNQYLILDAGGGTVDIAIHEVLTGDRIKELHKATGGAWGGAYLNDEFFKIFEECFGKDEFEKFKKDDFASYIELRKDLECKKRDISALTHRMSLTLTIPAHLRSKCDTTRSEFAKYLVCSTRKDKLEFHESLIKKLYSEACNTIVDHVSHLLEKHKIKSVLMVGGFSDSKFLQETMTKAFPDKTIFVPHEASLAVLKGAVLFGHKPSSIISRVARFTYGVETSLPVKDEETVLDEKRIAIIDGVRYERGVFSKHVTKGANLEVDKAQYEMAYLPVLKNQKTIRFRVYASSLENPKYVDDPECRPLGYINVDIPDTSEGPDRRVRVRFNFGATEIKVEGVNERTGEIASLKFV